MSGIYRFINTNIPTVGCNLRCEYCYIKQHGDENSVLKVDNSKQLFKYPVEHMIKALTVVRMGGICMFNISGSGETLLCPDIVGITRGLLENGHFVALINNCTIRPRIDEIVAFPEDFRKRLFFKVSFHYRELRRKNMLDDFVDNLLLLKHSGIAFSVEIVSDDSLLDDLDEVKAFSLKHFAALPHVLTGRDEQVVGTYNRSKTRLSEKEYDEAWSSFESDLFMYQQKANEIPHREFCYAGVYTGTLSLESGDFFPCPGTKKVTNFFEDIEKPINFIPIGGACPFDFCFCGFFLHVLAGVSRDYDPGVYFHQFRDRVCADGSTWLTPTIREAFDHRCSEYHEPYPRDKAFYIDKLMRKVYRDINPSEGELMELSRIAGGYMEARGYRRAAVYGMGKLGVWLAVVLEKAGVEIAYCIDRRAASIESAYPMFPPDKVMPACRTGGAEEPKTDADVIIVSVYSEFTAIAPMLRGKTSIPVASIVSLGDG